LAQYERYDKEYEEYIKYGAFPEVVLCESIDEKKLILENIFKSFFQMDILRLSQYQDVREIRDLILLLTRRIGSRLDVSRLASELAVQRHKIYSYLEFLQAIFVVKFVGVFSNSIDKMVSASKKVYFIDTGLVNQIAVVGEGELFENAVANSLFNHGELHYYQDKKQEIDFILNKKLAFEVKLTSTKSDYKKLEKVSTNLKLKDAYLVSKNFVKDKNVKTVYPQLF
jgi:predicted AAA+ superfamily ATPase